MLGTLWRLLTLGICNRTDGNNKETTSEYCSILWIPNNITTSTRNYHLWNKTNIFLNGMEHFTNQQEQA